MSQGYAGDIDPRALWRQMTGLPPYDPKSDADRYTANGHLDSGPQLAQPHLWRHIVSSTAHETDEAPAKARARLSFRKRRALSMHEKHCRFLAALKAK